MFSTAHWHQYVAYLTIVLSRATSADTALHEVANRLRSHVVVPGLQPGLVPPAARAQVDEFRERSMLTHLEIESFSAGGPRDTRDGDRALHGGGRSGAGPSLRARRLTDSGTPARYAPWRARRAPPAPRDGADRPARGGTPSTCGGRRLAGADGKAGRRKPTALEGLPGGACRVHPADRRVRHRLRRAGADGAAPGRWT